MKKAFECFDTKNKNVVFFDIFDTIIFRTVDPEYVKKIWSKRLSIYLGDLINYEVLYKLRNELEANCCTKSKESGMDLEFNYEEFASILYEVMLTNGMISAGVDKEEFKSICIGLEIEVESAVQTIDPDWLATVQKIKAQNKLVYCVSDIYLTKSMVATLFKFHGIWDLIDQLYVSSDFLLTKRSGRLYDVIFEQEPHLIKKDILMIGDNKVSDYEVPLSKEIDAYYVNREKQHLFYKQFREQLALPNYFDHKLLELSKLHKGKKDFIEVAFSLYYFIDSLHKSLSKDGIKDVFFLSREGEFLLELFEIYQENEKFGNLQYINAHYLKVSRKSTFLPSLKSLETEKFEVLFRQYINLSLFDFLSNLNFSSTDIERIAQQIKVDPRANIIDFPKSQQYKDLLSDRFFIETYEHTRNEQRENFYAYINQYGLDFSSKDICLVDVGWKGTIQDNIFKIFDEEKKIKGYYLGLVAPGNLQERNDKVGLLFSSIPYRTPYYGTFNENRALYEVVLGASHGSANSYQKKEGKIEVELLHMDKEKLLFEEAIKPLQMQIAALFREISKLLALKDLDLSQTLPTLANIHARLVWFPTRKEMIFFEKLYHYENFGVFTYSNFASDKKMSPMRSLKNLARLVKNPRGFLESGFWAPMTFREAGLGYLIPLYGRYKYKKDFKSISIGSNKNEGSLLNVEVVEMKKEISEQNEALKKMAQMIEDRDQAIGAMTKMIDDRDEAIKSMTKMIEERDDLIKKLS